MGGPGTGDQGPGGSTSGAVPPAIHPAPRADDALGVRAGGTGSPSAGSQFPVPQSHRREPILTGRGLGKSYPTATGDLRVLSGLDLDVYAGELVAVVGESGTGKSTLLHLLGALDRPTEGTLTFRGDDVFAKGDEALAAFRNRSIGFVFQFHHLLPEFNALENVQMPALIAGGTFATADGRARQLLAMLGLAERVDHRPSQLSGGEQQRVAVARALMNEPGLVLMDEPSGNLDTATAQTLHDELLRLSRDADQAFVVVTHNPTLAALADRVLALDGGRLADVTDQYRTPDAPAHAAPDPAPDAEPAPDADRQPGGGLGAAPESPAPARS